ncbi:unnamed protein product (macronuclear) [Paramecium tetraurelia]|uniref:Uncharacterized protein n=1 Tax=Paramecium tetraurelia TaxID=5888 RepID=A0C2R1_PARTE|nr:uncharacterized protein GSPATT00034556001 [Paramecium tetraurelia]CAK65078.1 unnamed protein product [Paramecium tetraurelia]|eukprot:XP_001432475.1 hypothetical protein (macronuclear) [Paramecium tetraurelia strain d4-2]
MHWINYFVLSHDLISYPNSTHHLLQQIIIWIHFELVDELLFINDVGLKQYGLILYDHNYIKYTNNQIGCIHHHEDKGQHFTQFKKLEKVGSAVTFVAKSMELEKNYKCKQEIGEIAQLIMKTILIDTFNFQQNQYQIRWMDKDKQILDLCHSSILNLMLKRVLISYRFELK